MSDRNDFSPATKRFVALRAGYRCSFTGCLIQTVGPSSQSESAYTNIGEAAHISGAAAGGPRYQARMSAEERAHISNAIWLCANHARLIDRDTSTFTVEVLLKMKGRHEAAMAKAIRGGAGAGGPYDLLALGPNIVCTGHLLKVDNSEWVVRLNHFVEGDFYGLVKFVSDFDALAVASRYIVLNELGDGRALSRPPSMERVDDGYLLSCPIRPNLERLRAQDLPRDFAFSPKTRDSYAEKGRIAEVSGLQALPQKIRSNLSLLLGESPMDPDAGSRIVQYFGAFRGSPWLAHFFKLETVRLAAIPYNDEFLKREYTPLQCVERVRSVVVLSEVPDNGWVPVRFDLDVTGVGRWVHDIHVLVEVKRAQIRAAEIPDQR